MESPGDRPCRDRILALDWGAKRIGLALSDELGIGAHPLDTLERKNRAHDLDYLCAAIEAHKVRLLVVGEPLHMDGRRSGSSSRAEQLGRTLAKRCGIELVMWDERLTSVDAEEIVSMASPKKRRRGEADRVAAALILRSYLDNTGGEAPQPAAE